LWQGHATKGEIEMSKIVGIWTGFKEAHVLVSNGIDILIDKRGNTEIRVEGQTIPRTFFGG